ncbi:VOC family protein [Mangrovimonas xylaniphaga]|uniref:VOC family protein n=1 Tax=Mangrovimonas xylaniphaga TaxID=1645915 RepID=UPI0006B59A04|nr:VOC family protein [Mangrovimonas xylaniphaga]
MAAINPYLTFNGNCEEAFNFYKSVFGGEFVYLGRFNEIPPGESEPGIPEAYQDKIMHISLPIGKHDILMGSDNHPAYGEVSFGQNINILISAETKEEADKLFIGLSEKGQITMPMADVFWGDYFGMVIDQFGVMWMVSFNKNA